MITLPKTFTGKGDVDVHNEGPQAHEVIFIKFKPGKTLADAAAWQAAGSKGPGPFTFAGGMGEIEPNETQQMHLDLPPGDYAALCVLPDVLGDGAAAPRPRHGHPVHRPLTRAAAAHGPDPGSRTRVRPVPRAPGHGAWTAARRPAPAPRR